ncbi:endonuclease/exonuclease/phosphatase family protein [Endozoicomonas arenosclerae]|uniref:endonuclease/exonuclease/phosphatase family protein n=1 Tax=Endozoicomonas arenosclerae TaxID=1633495 RepID=UPI0007807C0C|nr:endonuclease/exonuclease/phosphatase family protein [Endozoicomonas arenosclerae]
MKEFSPLLALLLWVSALVVADTEMLRIDDTRQSREPIPVNTNPPLTCPLNKSDQCSPLKLLTWNVNLMTSYDFFEFLIWWFGSQDMNDPELRAEEIAQYMVKRDYHIVALQEIADKYLRGVVNKEMRKAGYYMTPVLGEGWKWLLSGRLFNGGVVVYSKAPILEMREFVFPMPVGNQGWCAIGAWYVKVPTQSGNLHVFGLHLQTVQSDNEEEYKGLIKHYGYLKQIKNKLNIPRHEAVIYMGDFNSDAGRQDGMAQGDEYFQIMLETLVSRQAADFTNTSLPYSFDIHENEMAKGKTPLGTLDNILCDKRNVCPINGYMKILHANQTSSRLGVLSDHYPIEGILYFTRD